MDEISIVFNQKIKDIRNIVFDYCENQFGELVSFKNENKNPYDCFDYTMVESIYKQIVFETCFHFYDKECPQEPFYKYIQSKEHGIDDTLKKQYTRADNKKKENRDKKYIALGAPQEYIDIIHKHNRSKRMIKEYQKMEYEIMDFLSPLFYKLANLNYHKNHNYPDDDARDDLKQIERAYKMIEESETSYFEKCIHFYHLEVNYRIETMYKFFKAAKESNRPIKSLKTDIPIFKRLFEFATDYGVMQNHLITDIDVLVDLYKSYPDELDVIISNNITANKIRIELATPLKCVPISIYNMKDFITCQAAEDFFKDYIGMGQHIVRNKNYKEDINIKYFRRIY